MILIITYSSWVLFWQINVKRARILVKSHVVLHTVPGADFTALLFCAHSYSLRVHKVIFVDIGYSRCNKEENILSWERFLLPRVIFGVPLERMIGREGSSHMVWFFWVWYYFLIWIVWHKGDAYWHQKFFLFLRYYPSHDIRWFSFCPPF